MPGLHHSRLAMHVDSQHMTTNHSNALFMPIYLLFVSQIQTRTQNESITLASAAPPASPSGSHTIIA